MSRYLRPVLLQRTGAFEEHRFASLNGSIVLDFDGMSAFDPGTPDARTAKITHIDPLYDLQEDAFALTESGDNTGVMEGSLEKVNVNDVDYSKYTLESGATTDPIFSDGGDFRPFVVETLGPVDFRAMIEGVEIGGQVYHPTPVQNVWVLGDRFKPHPFLIVHDGTPPLVDFNAPPNQDGTWNYIKGVGFGLADTGVALVDGLVTLVEIGWHGAIHYNPPAVAYRILTEGRVLTIKDQARLDAAWETVQTLWNVVEKVMSDTDDYFAAVVTGDAEEINRLGEEYRAVFEFAAELFQALKTELGSLDDFEAGRIAGRILGETLLAVATFGVGTALKGATMVGVIEKLKNVSYIRNLGPVVAKLDDLLAFFNRLEQVGVSSPHF